MLAAYFIVYGFLLICAFYDKSAFPLAVVLTMSWAASFFSGLAGLGILAPYIDGLAFYGLLSLTLRNYTKANLYCTWVGVGLVAVHALFNGTAIFVTDWNVANKLANGYMWSINLACMAQALLTGGRNVRRLFGLALEGVRSLGRYPAGRRYARLQGCQKVEP